MASSITETHLTQSEPHPGATSPNPTVLAILCAISFSHLLNDTIQSLIPAIYPLLKTSFHLSFVQVGFIVDGDPLRPLRMGRTGLDDDQLAFIKPLAAVPVGLALGAI